MVALCGLCAGQSPKISDAGFETGLRAVQSPDWLVRSSGFYKLAGTSALSEPSASIPARRVKLLHAPNQLLERESDYLGSGAAPTTEEYSEYYANVIRDVTTLDEPSSLKVLMRCINTGGMATGARAGFGDESLAAALSLMGIADRETKHSLYGMLAQMTEARNMERPHQPESRLRLSRVLIAGAADGDPQIRMAVVGGLDIVGTP